MLPPWSVAWVLIMETQVKYWQGISLQSAMQRIIPYWVCWEIHCLPETWFLRVELRRHHQHLAVGWYLWSWWHQDGAVVKSPQSGARQTWFKSCFLPFHGLCDRGQWFTLCKPQVPYQETWVVMTLPLISGHPKCPESLACCPAHTNTHHVDICMIFMLVFRALFPLWSHLLLQTSL